MNPRTLTALFAAVLTLAGVLPAPPLLDAETDAMIRRDIAHEIRRRGGAERVMIMDYPNEEFIGKTSQEVAGLRGQADVVENGEILYSLPGKVITSRRDGAPISEQ